MKRISGSTTLLACGFVMPFALAVCPTSSLAAQTAETKVANANRTGTKTRFLLDGCARVDKSDDATAFTDCFAARILHATMADETVRA